MAKMVGAHVVLYSRNADADRALFRDVLALPSIDVGGGWLIFSLPPSEVAVHPGASSAHELYLMVDDLKAFIDAMASRGVNCTPPSDQQWGLVTQMTLPGGGALGVYQPRHGRPPAPATEELPIG